MSEHARHIQPRVPLWQLLPLQIKCGRPRVPTRLQPSALLARSKQGLYAPAGACSQRSWPCAPWRGRDAAQQTGEPGGWRRLPASHVCIPVSLLTARRVPVRVALLGRPTDHAVIGTAASVLRPTATRQRAAGSAASGPGSVVPERARCAAAHRRAGTRDGGGRDDGEEPCPPRAHAAKLCVLRDAWCWRARSFVGAKLV